jgi:hypothetical protein
MMASEGTGKSASFAAVSSVSALIVAKVRPRAAGAAPPLGSPSDEVLLPLPMPRSDTSGNPSAPLPREFHDKLVDHSATQAHMRLGWTSCRIQPQVRCTFS